MKQTLSRPLAVSHRRALVRIAVAASLCAFTAWGFGEIAQGIPEGQFTRFDTLVITMIHQHDTPARDIAMRALSYVGWPGTVLIALGVAAWAWLRKDKIASVVMLGAAVLSTALNMSMKVIFHRGRPTLVVEVPLPKDFSFPSGHTVAAVVVLGTAALVLGRVVPRMRAACYATAVVLMLGIGLSRVYLGVHWPTDVLAAFACGGLMCVVTRSVLVSLPRQDA